MLKLKFLFVLLLSTTALCSYSRTITTIENTPNYNYVRSTQNYSIYARDLNRIEMELFGQTYQKDSDEVRLNRIENKLYGKTYNNYSLSKRMNAILQDFSSDPYLSNRYCSPYATNNSLLGKIRDAFIGQPTGFTPSIPSPYINSFGPSYMRGYYGTNGWAQHNSYNPIYTSSGIHILD